MKIEQIQAEAKLKAQPFLRWAGSKKKILSVLATYYDNKSKRYVEPFVGSASLFFKINPPKAILGDINSDLISTYLEIKYRLPGVIKELNKLKEGEKEYYRLRKLDYKNIKHAKRAAIFIYLNRNCFNGLYRTNLKGQFNVPYGGSKSGKIPSSNLLKLCRNALKSTTLVAGDFETVLKKVRKGDFVYLDPPFSVSDRRVFKEYNGKVFAKEDIKRIRKWLDIFSKKNIPFVVSYAKSKEAKYLAKGFEKKIIKVRRNIAGFAKDRILSEEYIIFNRHDVKNK